MPRRAQLPLVLTLRPFQELAGRLREQYELLLQEPNLQLPTWILKARQAHFKVRPGGATGLHASELEQLCQSTHVAKQRMEKEKAQEQLSEFGLGVM